MTSKNTSNNKESVLAVVLLLLIIYAFTKAKYYIGITIVFIILALLFEKVSVATDFVWRKLTKVLGIISSTILLSVFFFLIFFPIGALLKLFNKSSFIRFSSNLKSTFEIRERLFVKSDIEQPF